MQIIDTHSHLYLEDFDEDRQEVVNRALTAGVTKILLPAVDSSSHRQMIAMVEKYGGICYPMIGLHPTSVVATYREELYEVKKQVESDNRYIAIGEVGLDLYWDKTYLEEQIETLKQQLDLAKEHKLPVVLHLRSAKECNDLSEDAYELFFDILENSDFGQNNGKPLGVMHCYSGNIEQALYAISKGFMIGIGGVVTYKKSTLQEVVKEIALDKIVVETDAPYLAPVPHRGQRNESSYIVETVKKIAELKGMGVEEVAERTRMNAEELFGV